MANDADLSLAEHVDAVCDQFERDFRAGKPPTLESLIADAQEPARSSLLKALVALEVEMRQKRGEQPRLEEYSARFPQHKACVQEAFVDARSILSSVKVNAVDTSRGPSASRAGQASAGADIEHLGRFEILSILGEGAFGTVYKARDPQLDREVAIKVPKAGSLQSSDDRERFLREARAAAGLHHAHICPVHEVGTIDGRDYIVMAFIEGKPLSAVIKSATKYGDKQIAMVVRKIALALQEAHEKGIIHRDLKPANVMINRKGEPVIMDFGLARRENSGDAQISQSGQIMGTPAYMSPEQARGDGKAVGPAADIHSLGVILYELLCGRRPYEGTIAEVIGRILHVNPDPPSRHGTDVDPRLEKICLKAIAKKPGDRYASMKEFAAVLGEYIKEPAKSTATDTKPPTQTMAASPGEVMDKQKNIQQFIQQGQLPAALEALQGLASSADPQLATWAKDQAAKVKADIKKWQEQLPSLTALGHKLIRKCDYGEAKNILSQVPVSLRPEEIREAIQEAEEKQEECDLLQMEIEAALRKERPKELPALVKRFLQLKPGHKEMQKLADDLKQYGAERAIKVRKGLRIGFADSGLNWKWIAAIACGFAALFTGVYFAVMAFLTPQGWVIVNVESPGVVVSFADNEITVDDGSGQKHKLKPTDRKTLTVEVNGTEIESAAREITVSKNKTKLITARLLPDKRLEMVIDDETMRFPPDAQPGPEPGDQNVAASNKPRRVEVKELNLTGHDTHSWISTDGKRIYWESRSPNNDVQHLINVAERPNADSPFAGKKTLFPGRHPTLTGDELEMVFIRGLAANSTLRIAKRNSTTENFGPESDIPELKGETNPKSPMLYEDGLTLLFQRGHADQNNIELVYCMRPNRTSPWSKPVKANITPDPTWTEPITWPFQSRDELTLWYSHGGGKTPDIRKATRPDKTSPFANHEPVIIEGTPLIGRAPRFVEATGELFYSQSISDTQNNWSLWVVKDYAPAKSAVSPADSWQIPADAVTFFGSAYKFFPEKLSWTDAKRRCEQLGGRLPIVESKEENDFLVQLCAGKFPKSDKAGGPTIWLGATDADKEGEWLTIDGKALTYTNWYKAGNQPNNGGKKGRENYATLLLADLPNLGGGTKAGGWSDQPDVPTQQDIYFVCEWDALPSSGTTGSTAGWTDLFNGKDLTNWTDVDGNPAAWKVENGYMEVTSNTKNIVTRDNFPLDFELHVEFWVPAELNKKDQQRGNSGIYLLGRHEIAICDGYQNSISRPETACGALYGQIAPSTNVSTAPETWQSFDITFRAPRADAGHNITTSGRLTVVHNGTKIIDDAKVERASPDVQQPKHGQPGPILLQNHGSPVRFRNIRLRPLEPQVAAADAAGWIELFNGQDLTGWKTVGTPKWSWSDGRLVGAPAPGQGAGFLMTEAEYDDFELELEFRLNAGIGSGLFLRTDPNGPISGKEQLEIQIADDETFNLKPPGATGAVFNIFPRKATPPLRRDDWNTMRVRLNQRRIEVWVNEAQTVDADLDSARDKFATVPGLTRTSGRIALQQNQRADVEFRNVRIRPLGTTGPAEAAWSPLFPGNDISDWNGSQQLWSMTNGELVGRPSTGEGNVFLMSPRTYRDFELRCQVKAPGDNINSGIQIRSGIADRQKGTARGPQADIGNRQGDFWGGLYGEKMSGWLLKPARVPAIRRDDFNDYYIHCVGKHVVIKVNDVVTVDGDVSEMAAEGLLGFQIHAGNKSNVTFRNIEIRELNSATTLPADAQTHNGHAYKFFAEQISWKEARDRCAEMGGHLIVIDDAAENQFAAGLVAAANWEDAWIGATDEAEEGDWKSVKGDPLQFTNWHTGQPNNKPPGENFALMSNKDFAQGKLGWKWSDQPKNSTQHKPGYLCEWDALSGDQAAIDPNNWTDLFNGEDLSAWNTRSPGTKDWGIESGVLTYRGKSRSHLFTVRDDYQNFHLRAEMRVPSGGNSGIWFGCEPGSDYPFGFEVDAMAAEPERVGGILRFNPNGWGEKFVPPNRQLLKPNQWFTVEVIVRDNHVKSTVDGVTRVDTELPRQYRTRGHLALQTNSGESVEFRKVQIHEFSAN